MAENFFSILKTECIYRHLPATLDEARTLIDNYIYFYNHQRIQLKTGVTPLTLRHSLKLIFSYQGLFCAVRTIWGTPLLFSSILKGYYFSYDFHIKMIFEGY